MSKTPAKGSSQSSEAVRLLSTREPAVKGAATQHSGGNLVRDKGGLLDGPEHVRGGCFSLDHGGSGPSHNGADVAFNSDEFVVVWR